MSGCVLIDGHAHLHSCFDTATFLDSAYENFEYVAREVGHEAFFSGVLVITDGLAQRGFERLRDDCARHRSRDARFERWEMYPTDEDTSLCLMAADREVLIAIAGRQIRTKENLEVLAVGTRCQFQESLPITDVIRNVVGEGAIPVVPWGFGKWLGGRGRVIKQLMRDSELPPFFVGDSGNRPCWWPRPAAFRLAEEKGIVNLPGSDPLPFRRENVRPGDTGAIIHRSISRTTPLRDLKEILSSPSNRVQAYRNNASSFRLLRGQFALSYRKLQNKWKSFATRK